MSTLWPLLHVDDPTLETNFRWIGQNFNKIQQGEVTIRSGNGNDVPIPSIGKLPQGASGAQYSLPGQVLVDAAYFYLLTGGTGDNTEVGRVNRTTGVASTVTGLATTGASTLTAMFDDGTALWLNGSGLSGTTITVASVDKASWTKGTTATGIALNASDLPDKDIFVSSSRIFLVGGLNTGNFTPRLYTFSKVGGTVTSTDLSASGNSVRAYGTCFIPDITRTSLYVPVYDQVSAAFVLKQIDVATAAVTNTYTSTALRGMITFSGVAVGTVLWFPCYAYVTATVGTPARYGYSLVSFNTVTGTFTQYPIAGIPGSGLGGSYSRNIVTDGTYVYLVGGCDIAGTRGFYLVRFDTVALTYKIKLIPFDMAPVSAKRADKLVIDVDGTTPLAIGAPDGAKTGSLYWLNLSQFTWN